MCLICLGVSPLVSRDEAIDLIREAIQMHIESLRENGANDRNSAGW
jgi:hypothetical protein